MSVFPVFMFERHREIEVESGGAVELAGTLRLNTSVAGALRVVSGWSARKSSVA